MPVVNADHFKRTKNWRVLLYGKPGVGKTSSVRFLKGKTLVLSLDNSQRVLAGTDVDIWKDPKLDPDDQSAMFNRADPSDSIIQFINENGSNQNGYANIVIDNISSLEKDWFVEQGRKSHNGISNEIQDYGTWGNYFTRLTMTLFAIPNVNVLVTAWENTRNITAESGQSFSQYAPAIRDSVRDGLLGLTDVVGRLMVNPKTGGRGVILEGTDAIFAKNRLDHRTSAPIEELFAFGGDGDDVHATSVPGGASQPSKTKASGGQ